MIRYMEMGLALVLLGSFWGEAMAQSTTDCNSALNSLIPCASYVTSDSSSTPGTGCCMGVVSVVKNQPQCLCVLLRRSDQGAGLGVNRTKVLELPKACNVDTPPLNQCEANAPASSPLGKPSIPFPELKDKTSDGGNALRSTTHWMFFLIVGSFLSFSSF